MTILEVRGLVLSEETRQRIVDCRDLALLDSWTRRAVMIDTVDDLWEES